MELIDQSASKRVALEDNREYVLGRRSENRAKRVSRLQVSLVADSVNNCTRVSNLGINNIRVNDDLLKYRETVTVQGGLRLDLPDDIKFKVRGDDRTDMDDEMMSLEVLDGVRREMSMRDELDLGWNEVDNGRQMVYLNAAHSGTRTDRKVAAFDMDGTLINTRSGKTFPVNEHDWVFYSDKVVGTLKRLHADGYGLAVFTNQAGVALGSTNKIKLKTKIENIVAELDVPIQVYVATGFNFYRKPCPGMWYSYMIVNRCSVDYAGSVYVGDAAGRPQGWSKGKKKDFSTADRLFARNAKLKFLTPEEFFLGQSPVPFQEPDFDPKNLVVRGHADYDISSPETEVILMVGSPASGKSHFVESHLLGNGYVSVSRDVLNSWQNCIKAMEKYLGLNNKVVIDNTNPNMAARERFVSVAKRFSVPVRCFIMEPTVELCKHNNKFRQITDKDHVLITDPIINDYWKKYEPPTEEEGFHQVVTVPFVPAFKNKVEENLYRMHLN